jgi:hypothetical protein
VAEYALPCLAFIALYSKLPHKELRFLLPGMPLLQLAAGSGFAKLADFAVSLLTSTSAIASSPQHDSRQHRSEPMSSCTAEAAPREGLRLRKPSSSDPFPSPARWHAHSSDTRPSATTTSKLLGVALAASIASIIVGSAAGTALFVRVAMDNYPGGGALQRLYTLHQESLDVETGSCIISDVTTSGIFEWWRQCLASSSIAPVMCFTSRLPSSAHRCVPTGVPSVHVDVAAAVSGVSRFGESWSAAWAVNKSEGLRDIEQFNHFDYLITEAPDNYYANFDVMERVHSFSRLKWLPMPHIERKAVLAIMKRRTE